MTIQLVKFGTMLTSRPLGREAFAAFRPTLEARDKAEPVTVDFTGVLTFSPSWGDEFFSALLDAVKGKLILKNTANPSVQATLEVLKELYGNRFEIRD